MAENDRYPLLKLSAPRSLARKKIVPKFPPARTRDVVVHGRMLLAGVQAAQDRTVDAARISTNLATDVPYVRLEPDAGMSLSESDIRALGLVPVLRREDKIIAAYATDGKFGALRRKLAAYVQKTAKHEVLSRIETLSPWTRADRTSPALAAITFEQDVEYTVDVLLLPIDGAWR